MKTQFVKHTNPWTGEMDQVFSEIPDRPIRGRGTSKFDSIFTRLMDCKEAYEVRTDDFEAIRRAAKRYIDTRGLKNICVRQMKFNRAGIYKIWFEKK